MSADRSFLAERLRSQAMWCARLGSPLYERLLGVAATDLESGGPVWKVLRDLPVERADSAPLGLMGAVHRLVLQGRVPELSRFFPSAEGNPMAGDPRPGFLSAVEGHVEELRELVVRPIQTNEVGRSACLVGGFLLVARETGLPMRLLEIGASAGLNLRWDHYRYECGGRGMGPQDSPVRFVEPFEDGSPPLDAEALVVSRAGCDVEPVDPTTEDGRFTLMSYTWPDQVERFERLRGALDVAPRVPAQLERADALEWLGRRLALENDATTVVFHSIIELYLSPEERDHLRTLLGQAGAAASPDAPLAWLRMEHTDTDDPDARGWARLGPPEVRLTLWPGGVERRIALSWPHGPPVRWLG
jgi:hypothetical protein